MIIIPKKRILVIVSFLCASLFVGSLAVNMERETLTNTVETVAVPVTNKVIVIDAGHGVPDEGAQSSTRNNRGRNKFKNSIKIAKFA